MKFIASLVFLLLVFAGNSSAQKSSEKNHAENPKPRSHVHRIVMQLSSADTLEHKAMTMNLKNLKEGWGDSVQIEVVVHGPGIGFIIKEKSTQPETVQELMKKGIEFVVCRNTMKQRNVTEAQIMPNVKFVPMGVGEIVLKQEEGWSYLKAGF